MTPEQEDALVSDVLRVRGGTYEALSVSIRLAIRAAVAQERERCAAICESVNNYDNPMTANDCAAAIRRG